MRVSLIPICCCVLISSVYAYADDNSTELRELLRQFDDGKGNLDVTKLQAFYRRSGEAKTVKAAQKAAVAPVGEPVPPSDKPYVDAGSDEKLTGTHATLLLRKNFTDFFLFDDPGDAASAAGAAMSYSRDAVTDDDVWSLHGMVALPIEYRGAYESVLGASIAPYVEFNLDNHSSDASARTVEFGASGEIGFDLGVWSSYFRGRLGIVNDDVDDYTDVASSLEWIPVSLRCIDFPCAVPGTPIIYRFRPSLLLQYDHATSGLNPFSDEQDAIRLGPVLTLDFVPFGPGDSLLNRIVGNVSYHVDTEFYSGRTFDWFDASLTYNLTSSGNLGLTATYQRGEDEKTADDTDKFEVSLSGKL